MGEFRAFELELSSLHLDADDVGRPLVALEHVSPLVRVAGRQRVAAHQLRQPVHADVRRPHYL